MHFLSELSGLRSLAAAMMVGAICGVLGCFVVLRNMALIGDALSHAVLPGIVIAFIAMGYSTTAFFGGALLSGLLSAFFITWLQKNVMVKNDAAIGIIFTFMFALGVIGISALSHKEGMHLDLKDFLFSNVLSVTNEDLCLIAGMSVIVISCVVLFYKALFVTSFQSQIAESLGIKPSYVHYLFMLLLSLTIVSSLSSVGVILVVAMLITPASTALLIANQLPKVLITAGLLGILSSMTGLLLSAAFNLPPGPMMAVVATLIYALTFLIHPKNGLIAKWLQKRNLENRIIVEDILKLSSKLEAQSDVNIQKLISFSGHSKKELEKWLKILIKKGLLLSSNEGIKLSEEGKIRANQLVRAHRLWESYLANELGLEPDQIHDEAEQFEHYMTEEFLSEVDESLGYPQTDPHGSPIPKA